MKIRHRLGNPRRYRLCGISLVVASGLIIAACASRPQADTTVPPETRRPNLVIILVDDMRWDVMSSAGHPFVRTPNIDRIAAAGVRFTNAFVTTSLCSPSRASFLTGVYARTHGVRHNVENEIDPSVRTYAQLLQEAGYATAFVGKWHMSGNPNPRPGFDYWLSFAGQGRYVDPPLNENGRRFRATGYVTDLLTDYAVRYLTRPHDGPICLTVSHKAMHTDFTPADRHATLYDSSLIRAPESHGDTLAGKPKWQRTLAIRGGQLDKPAPREGIPDSLEPAPWDPEGWRNVARLNWHRTLAAVDESVGRILDTLRAKGMSDNTVVVFASDNGFFLGEHRRIDKRMAYEESIRIPMLIGGSGVVRPGRVTSEMILNIDVAPTLLELAGVPVPQTMQGQSIVPFLRNRRPAGWRSSFFYEYYREDWIPGIPTMYAVRTDRWKYVHYPEIHDIGELYDLKRDPREMTNLIDNPSSANRVEQLHALLEKLAEQLR